MLDLHQPAVGMFSRNIRFKFDLVVIFVYSTWVRHSYFIVIVLHINYDLKKFEHKSLE